MNEFGEATPKMLAENLDVSEDDVVAAKNFICSVCLCIVSEPVQTKCDHIFCKTCIGGIELATGFAFGIVKIRPYDGNSNCVSCIIIVRCTSIVKFLTRK